MPKNIPQTQQSSCADCPARPFSWFKPISNQKQLENAQRLRSTQTTFQAGESLFIEGSIHRKIHTLKEGWAVIYKHLLDGHRQVIDIALPGDLLAYQSNFDIPIDHSVICATDCVFCSFTEDAIDKLLHENPILHKRLLHLQGIETKNCRKNLSLVGGAQARNKVAYFLHNLIDRLETRDINITEDIIFPISREDMADAIGVTHVHLSRICAQLNKENIVKLKNNRLRIVNRKKLQKLANIVL